MKASKALPDVGNKIPSGHVKNLLRGKQSNHTKRLSCFSLMKFCLQECITEKWKEIPIWLESAKADLSSARYL